MTPEQLKDYVKNIEHRWNGDSFAIFPSFSQLESLCSMMGPTAFDDGGWEMVLMNGYAYIELNDIADYYGIELEKLFRKS